MKKIIFFVALIISSQNFLSQLIYLNNNKCEFPYTQGISYKIGVCNVLGKNSSTRIRTNQTHITQTQCGDETCQTNCREVSNILTFDKCIVSSPYSTKFAIGELRARQQHAYTKYYTSMESCEGNKDVPMLSLVKDKCVNLPMNLSPYFFSMEKLNTKSYFVGIENEKYIMKVYSELLCKGLETITTIDTLKCIENNQQFIKASDKPYF
jgi:hypothetical protein